MRGVWAEGRKRNGVQERKREREGKAWAKGLLDTVIGSLMTGEDC